MDFHQTWSVHWYCRGLVWDCWWANFVKFWRSYLFETRPNFVSDDNLSKLGFVVCLSVCHFVLVFFSPFSIAITSLGEERANLSAFRTIVWFVLVWICRFSLPLRVWEGLRFVVVALPGLFSYLLFQWIFTILSLCIDIVERSGLGLQMGKFRQILTELSARDTPIFSFPDDNLSDCQGILTKLGTCIDMK